VGLVVSAGGTGVPGASVVVGSGDCDVVGSGMRDVVFGIDGFVLVPVTGGTGTATVDSLDELVTMTRAMTSPTTRSTATAARIHSQRGDFGGPGGACGGSVGW
jgi:hypothetical protein